MARKILKPDKVISAKKNFIHDVVFDVINELIIEKWNGHFAQFKQKEIITRICGRSSLSKDKIFDKHYLDIEDIYRDMGWDVRYDAPAYCETYDAFFVFKNQK